MHVGMVEAISSLKDLCRKNQGKSPVSEQAVRTMNMNSRELLHFGLLRIHWESLVGQDLSCHAFPQRLMHGHLFIVCSSSPWLQTLHYLKGEILSKIRTRFPEMKIQEIQGTVGNMVQPVVSVQEKPWPDWEKEPEQPIAGKIDPELKPILSRVLRKSQARLRGLKEKGLVLCPQCQFLMIPQTSDACSVCRSRNRELALLKQPQYLLREALKETPWLNFDEVKKQIPEIREEDFQQIHAELLGESQKRLEEFLRELKKHGFRDSEKEWVSEIALELMLREHVSPDKIHFDDDQTL